jgi:hypothetical protein
MRSKRRSKEVEARGSFVQKESAIAVVAPICRHESSMAHVQDNRHGVQMRKTTHDGHKTEGKTKGRNEGTAHPTEFSSLTSGKDLRVRRVSQNEVMRKDESRMQTRAEI